MDEGRIHYFVSFAYKDNERPRDEPAGWVSTFADDLDRYLKQITNLDDDQISRTLSEDDRKSAAVTDYIEKRIRKADLFVAFVSNSVMGSELCGQERQAFIRECNRAGVKAANRTFVIQLANLVPEELTTCRGRYRFFKEGASKNVVQPLCLPVPGSKSHPDDYATYNASVYEVAYNMWEALLDEGIKPTVGKKNLAQRTTPAKKAFVSLSSKADEGRPRDRRVFVHGIGPDAPLVKQVTKKLRDKGFLKANYSVDAPTLSFGRGDPNVEFQNGVMGNDIVVVLREKADQGEVVLRHQFAAKQFAKPGKDQRHALLLDAARDSSLENDEENRVIVLRPRRRASAAQCAERILAETSQ